MPPTGANTKVKDPEYCNWLKVGLALYYLKVGLSSFIQNEVDAMHQYLIQKLHNGSAPHCSSCDAKDVRQNRNVYTWKFRTSCPQRLCDTWLTELLALHTNPTSNKLYCENCDVTAWPHASWECAKLYMPRGQTVTNTGPSQCDSQALLTLMANCKYFHSKLSQGGIQLTHTVSTIRNKVMHSGDMRLSDIERKSFIQDIINLLEDPNHLKSLEECKQAVAEINKINNDSIDIFFNIDLEMKALSEYIKDCRQELGVHKVEAEKTVDSLKITEKTVDSLKEELKDLKVQFDTFEKETKDKVGDIDRKYQEMDTSVKKLSRTVTSGLKHVKRQVRTQGAVMKKAVDSLKRKSVTDRSLQNKKLRKLGQEMQLMKGSNSEASRATADKFGDLHTKCKKMGTKVTKMSRSVENVQRQVRIQNKRSSLIKKKVLTDLNQQRIKVRKLDQEMQLRKESTSRGDVRDIQMLFVKAYESVQIISINPVFDNAVNWKELEDFYTDIVIEEEKEESNQKRKDEQQTNKKVTSFRQIFEKDCKKVTRIILKAPAGQGKSTFCRKLVHTWCSVQKKRLNILSDDGMPNKSETNGLKDEDEMLRFDILLYVCLRDISDEKTLIDVVYTQFPLHESQGLSHRSHIEAMIGQAEENKVLLIMDGLDEMEDSSAFIANIMQKRMYPYLTVLATTRPWKIGQLSLIRSAHIDLLLDLQGFSFDNSMLFAKRIFDKFYKDESAIAQFEKDIWTNDVIESIIHVPLLLLFIVHVWYERKSFPQTIHELYMEILNVMVNRYMEGKGRKEKKKEGQDDKKYLLQKTWPLERTTFIVTPKLRNLALVQCFGEGFLAALCEVANHFLITDGEETSLVFEEKALMALLGKDGFSKLQIALDLGILSNSESPGIFRKKTCLTFLHKTVQELLAAINICCREDRYSIFLDSLKTLDDVFQNEQILKFVAGISTSHCQKIFEKIYDVCDKEIDIKIINIADDTGDLICRFYRDCIVETCREPVDLKLYYLHAINDEDWKFWSSSNVQTYLKKMDLYSLRLVDISLDFSQFNCLEYLRLIHVTMNGKLLLSKCTHLKYLKLMDCNFDDATLDLSESNFLEGLSFGDVTMKGKLLVSKCTQLKCLKMKDCTLDDATLDLSESNCLEYLRLVYVTMKGKLLVSKCTQLKCLKMKDCTLDDATLDLSESNCLEYLRLVNVTMKGKLLVSKCTQLKCLKMKDCTLDDATLDLSESNCLVHLILKGVIMKGKLLVSNSNRLEFLKLQKCSFDDAILDLSESNCLKHLGLRDMTMKSNLLLSKCTQLKYLKLQNCHFDIAALDLSESNCLEHFFCNKVTMTGKSRLVLSNCTRLKCVKLTSCVLVNATVDLSKSTCLERFLYEKVTMTDRSRLSNCSHFEEMMFAKCSLGEFKLDLLGSTCLIKPIHNDESHCNQMQCLTMKNADLSDALLSLDNVNHQIEFTLTMNKEWKIFHNGQDKQAYRLSLKNVGLCDAQLSLDSVDYLDELTLDNVTMNKECKEVLCNSLSQCKKLHRFSIKNMDLCDTILSLDSVNDFFELAFDNVTMRKESKDMLFKSLCKSRWLTTLSITNMDLDDTLLGFHSLHKLHLNNVTLDIDSKILLFLTLSQCEWLKDLSLKNIDLSDGLHELYNMNRLTNITIDNVKMGKISKVLMCTSLSQCIQLCALLLRNLDLDEGLFSLNNLGKLCSLTVNNVTMCQDGYLMLCNGISTCKTLMYLSLNDLDLGDGLLILNNLHILHSLSIDNVTMCKDGYVMMCNSMSMCERLCTLSLKDLDMGDGLLSLNNLHILHSLSIDNVTMCKDGYVMMCNSISTCKTLKSLSLKNLDLGDARPSLDKLKELELVNLTMSIECADYIKSSVQRLNSPDHNSSEHTVKLTIKKNATCEKCVVNYTNIRSIDDDDDDDDDVDDDDDDDDDYIRFCYHRHFLCRHDYLYYVFCKYCEYSDDEDDYL